MSANILSKLQSSVQRVEFYNSNFGSIRTVPLPFKSGLDNEISGLAAPVCNFKTELYYTTLSRQQNFDGVRFAHQFELEIVSTNITASFEGLRSSLQIFSSTGNVFEILQPSRFIVFDPSQLDITFRRVRLSPAKVYPIVFGSPQYGTLAPSAFPGVLRNALNVAIISMRSSFKLQLPSNDGKFLVKKHDPQRNILPQINRGVMDLQEKACIQFFFTVRGGVSRQSYGAFKNHSDIDTSGPVHHVAELTTFAGKTFSSFTLNRARAFAGIRSGWFNFRGRLHEWQGVRYALTTNYFNHNFEGVRSGVFNPLRTIAGSATSVFVSLEGLRVSIFTINAKSYAQEDLVTIPSSLYYLARSVGLRSFEPVRSNTIKVYIPFTLARGFLGMTLPLVDFSTVIEIRETMNFAGLRSNWFYFLIGHKELINSDGLYKDIFIDSTPTIPHPYTAKTPSESALRRISPARYQNQIKFTDGLNVFQVIGQRHEGILLDWESTRLESEVFILPPFELAPYIKLENHDGTDFVLIAVGPTGGSIVHIHKKGYRQDTIPGGAYDTQEEILFDENGELIVFPTLNKDEVEAAVIVVGSHKYRKYAKILKEHNSGVLWEQPYIDEAVAYMDKHKDLTLLFLDLAYSPVVLRSIIFNKMGGITDKDAFTTPDLFIYPSATDEVVTIDSSGVIEGAENTIFIHEDLDAMTQNGFSCTYVVSQNDVRLGGSPMMIASFFNTVKLQGLRSEPAISNCTEGTLCAKVRFRKHHKFNRIIRTGTYNTVTADMDTSMGIWGLEKQESLSPYGLGEVNTISGARFDHSINLVVQRTILGLRAAPFGFTTTFGTTFEGFTFTFPFQIGLDSWSGIRSAPQNFKIKLFNSNFDAVRADFKIRVVVRWQRDNFDGLRTVPLTITFNKNVRKFEGVSNERRDVIWLKIFPEHFAGKSSIEAKFMDFYISTKDFALNLNFPFDYIESLVKPDDGVSKSGTADIKEKKVLEFDEIPENETVDAQRIDTLCGSLRTTTYLEYMNFSHLFAEGDNLVYGQNTWEDKKLIMSAYIRKIERSVIRAGVKFSEADILRRTLVERKLSSIEDLEVVENWHLDEFTLTAADFGLDSQDAEQLTAVDEVFRAALKSVLENIGDDSATRERETETNQFPAFPERPMIGNELSESVKPKQFFIVEEIPN